MDRIEALERVAEAALFFLARARECCAELNPNNYDQKSLLWQAEADLGKLLEALQSANPTLDPGSVGLSANPMTGKSIDKPISPSNEDVLARMAEAESADLPHIKLKDEARGEVDHWRKKWEDLEMNRASCCMEMELENKQLTSKLERMERALEQISRTDVSEDWDVVWLVLWRNNAKAIARQALTDEVGG